MNKRPSESASETSKRTRVEPFLNATLIRREEDATLDTCRRKVFTAVYELSHNIEDLDHLETFESDFDDLYRQMLEPLISNCDPEDIIAVRLQDDDNLGKSTLTRGEIFVTYKRKAKIDYKELSLKLRKVAQSSTQFLEFGLLKMTVSIVKPFRGGHIPRGRNRVVSVPSYIISRRSLVQIKTLDCYPNSCGYLALALGVYHTRNLAHMKSPPRVLKNRFRNLRQSAAMLTNAARDLYTSLNIPLDLHQPVGQLQLEIIQKALENEIHIIVLTRPNVEVQRRSVPCTFVGRSQAKTKLTLEYDGDLNSLGHYGLVTKPGRYVDAAFFCYECFTGYSKKDVHFCSAICKSCKKPRCEKDELLECSACRMVCNSFECLERHLEQTCAKFKYCVMCESRYTVNKHKTHKCDYHYCSRCDLEYQGTHFHYLTPLDAEKLKVQDSIRKVIIAYDIEACQVEQANGRFRHEANLLIAHTCCTDCWNHDERRREHCEACGDLERIYAGENCVKEFCDYLINEVSVAADKMSFVDIYAHNAKNYDSRFILRELLQRRLKDHELIMQGSKITKMTVVQEFRKEFQRITDIDPTTRCFTLPGIGQEIFRSKQLVKHTIGVTPVNSYQITRDSLKCRAWLDTIEEFENIKIKREYKLGNFYADGYDPSSQTVFEFWGCYYHGCRCIFKDSEAMVTGLNQPVHQLRKRVEDKLAYYGRRGLKIVQLWEHDFEQLNLDMAGMSQRYVRYLEKMRNGNHCNIRDAFFGGRTDEIKEEFGVDAVCKRACFLGPKTYAYEVTLGDGTQKAIVKCKGITLYYSPLNKFSRFDDVMAVAKNYGQGDNTAVVFEQAGIRPNVNTHVMDTVYFDKRITARMDKRRLNNETGYSLPIGYREEPIY
ncbi:hypothetical protein HDE_09793 [Halotydeus destructor]|nr:hypothetical protein HDE_09793 [Halotydeus destructor]